jgi:phosphoserine phosphatase RsbX
MSAADTQLLDYEVAARALSDGDVSGDQHLVTASAHGLLLAVVDGLGHGPDAARAARVALETVERAPNRSLLSLLEDCHKALRPTRGAAMILAELDTRDQMMSWASVGNVEGMLLRQTEDGTREKEYVLMRGGIVGHRLPPLRATSLALVPGDLLVFATDGIRSGFEKAIDISAPVSRSADAILRRYGKSTDDALVLVARWRGARFDGQGAP